MRNMSPTRKTIQMVSNYPYNSSLLSQPRIITEMIIPTRATRTTTMAIVLPRPHTSTTTLVMMTGLTDMKHASHTEISIHNNLS